jgi:hypothetical protein
VRRPFSRLLFGLVALSLAVALPGIALASAPWSADCSGALSSSQLCIFRDTDYNGNIAHMSGDNLSYQSETWPSTNTNVEDSVSSMKNLYSSWRIRWWKGRNYTESFVCLNQNSGFTSLGIGPFGYNDTISSHELTAGNCP